MGQESVLQRLREELERQQLTVATGESCTLGRVAASLGAPAGASGWLRGGILAYHPELKVSLLGVPERLIAERLTQWWLSPEAQRGITEAERLLSELRHRPLSSEPEAHRERLERLEAKLAAFYRKYPSALDLAALV